MSKKKLLCSEQIAKELARAARDNSPVSGLTHNFYRYPARFSPTFASTAINLFSHPGDIVLDPFCGSGSILVAAKELGRPAVGVEIDERWARIAVERLGQGAMVFEDQYGKVVAGHGRGTETTCGVQAVAEVLAEDAEVEAGGHAEV